MSSLILCIIAAKGGKGFNWVESLHIAARTFNDNL